MLDVATVIQGVLCACLYPDFYQAKLVQLYLCVQQTLLQTYLWSAVLYQFR